MRLERWRQWFANGELLECDVPVMCECVLASLAPIEAFGRDNEDWLDPEGTKAGIAPNPIGLSPY